MKPDAIKHNPDPAYLRGVLGKSGLTQRAAAEAIGISPRLLRYYLTDRDGDFREAPYPVQYALERLAMEPIGIADVVAEVGSIADILADSPLSFLSQQTHEGITAMQQAAKAFAGAQDAADRLDAALWINEAYLIFSTSLPDNVVDERKSGWATANQIAKLFGGGPAIWEDRVRKEFEASVRGA